MVSVELTAEQVYRDLCPPLVAAAARLRDRRRSRQEEIGHPAADALRYPRDAEIKALNLSSDQVDSYMCVQRMHQNNVEFLSCYFPAMLVAMLGYPAETYHAGVVVLVGRMVMALGYYGGAKKRVFGGFFHFGEYYTIYLAGKFAYDLIQGA